VAAVPVVVYGKKTEMLYEIKITDEAFVLNDGWSRVAEAYLSGILVTPRWSHTFIG